MAFSIPIDPLVDMLDRLSVDKVILVPGELNSTKNYPLPELAQLFPGKDVVTFTNWLSRLALRLSKTADTIPEGNAYVYSLAKAYPERIIQFYWALISKPDTLKTMETRFSEWGFKGLKLHQCWEPFRVCSDGFERVARFATRHALPIFLHMGSYPEVKALIEWIRYHPEAKLIIGHLYGLELYIQSGVKMENVYFDITNTHLVSDKRVLQAIHHFGAERVTLGSDTPYGKDSLGLNIARVKALSISQAEKELILGDNLRSLLHL